MPNQIRLMLPVVCIPIMILVLGCSSPEEQGLTLNNVQDIGFETEEDIDKELKKIRMPLYYKELLKCLDKTIELIEKK